MERRVAVKCYAGVRWSFVEKRVDGNACVVRNDVGNRGAAGSVTRPNDTFRQVRRLKGGVRLLGFIFLILSRFSFFFFFFKVLL